MPELSVIIVNYNTGDYLQTCLASVLAQQGASFEVLVVDNASQDHSVSLVQDRFPTVRLIASPDNLGFAKANNLAAREALGRYHYYLNPDTEVRPGCFATVIRFLDQHPGLGMAGTRILYPDNTAQGSVESRYPGQRYCDTDLGRLPGKIAWLLGASLVARAEVIRQVGGFSEDFFLYGEDIDLGLKIRQAGWELGFIPEAEIVHWEGKSERQTTTLALHKKKLAAEALFYRRHYSRQTIAKICRANIRQAAWRLFTLRLELLLAKDPKLIRKKIERYRLARDFFQKLAAEIRQD